MLTSIFFQQFSNSMNFKYLSGILFCLSLLLACNKETDPGELLLQDIFVGSRSLSLADNTFEDIPPDLSLDLAFNTELDPTTVSEGIVLYGPNGKVELSESYFNEGRNIRLSPKKILAEGNDYTLELNSRLLSITGASFPEKRSYVLRILTKPFQLLDADISGQALTAYNRTLDVTLNPVIRLTFSTAISLDAVRSLLKIRGKNIPSQVLALQEEDNVLQIAFASPLMSLSAYELELSAGNYGADGQPGPGISREFYTEAPANDVFPRISDEALLTLIQEQTFRYFWDYAHPVSGLARERGPGGQVVTMGGTGFGLMAMIVAVERGFISREAAVQRWTTMVDFLAQADRFHGVWPHWMDGNTGKVIPFSTKDNGGDLVETAFLVQGLLTVRQYLNPNDALEKPIIDKINDLWEEIEWSWYTKGGEKQLYWHWSPQYNFDINLPIRGHNETQIVYILAAASTNHSIDLATYRNGYARNGDMVKNRTHYGLSLPLGNSSYGGPLFFTHYSYLGLDPRNLKDEYADYWQQNVNHSLINYYYCEENPKSYAGYSADSWGLTASYSTNGYSAHSPTNDLGVIAPTAAVSSLPFTPEESMRAIRHFYYRLGDRLWGEYGFYDAFSATDEWYSRGWLAIDQGPQICMIENYRSGLLWELFMSAPEIRSGLEKLNFTYE